MKKPFIMLMMSSCLLSTPSIAQVVVNDPVATSQAVITCGNARFTVLTPEMIRVEYSEQVKFEDRATFTIVNRKLDAPQFTKSEDDTYLYITTSNLKLKYRKGTSKEAPSSRSYKLLIYNTDKPLSAKVDGMQVTFTYNAESKCTTIEVPSASCSMEHRIEVEYATSSAVASITANDAKIAYDSASTKFIASAQCSKKILVE